MISYKYTHLGTPPVKQPGVRPDEKYYHSETVFPGQNKRYYGTYCEDDEWEVFTKYGDRDATYWSLGTPQERAHFKPYIELYQAFWELYYEHYEDLCLYAAMYRNVNRLLSTLGNVKSVRHFVEQASEIKGFKQKIIKDGSIHGKAALLYIDNRGIFDSVMSKYLNSNNSICTIPNNCNDIIDDFIGNSREQNTGIVNLTEEECALILKHKGELQAEYQRLYDASLKDYVVKQKGVSYSNDFFVSKFIPYIGHHDNSSSSLERLLKLESESLYIKISKAEITPVLPSDSRDLYLSNLERIIVGKWCRDNLARYKARLKEAEIRAERERELEQERKRKAEEARQERTRFNIRNRHRRDGDISFDAALHQYKVNGIILQSVTNFVEGCFPKFDAEFHAKRKAAAMGITTKEVLDMWERKGKEASNLGTLLHKKIENYFQELGSVEDDAFKLFRQFADKMKLKPYRTEWAVYDWEAKIAGTIDFVDYQNGEYIIYDWKRSEKIIKNGMPVKADKYGDKGNYPLGHLDNSAYYHYALQLSLYKYILEKNYGIKISDLRLGIFHPSYDKPYVLRMPYLEDEINKLFGLRSEVIF